MSNFAQALRESRPHVPAEAGNDDAAAWPEPLPLVAQVKPEPYPLDALPPVLRDAVREVADFVKAPLPLVAGAALSALSAAAQVHADVRRALKLESATGLYLLTIADSGERKTTCDGFFTRVIRDWEAEQAEAGKPELKQYRDDKAAWEAQRAGLLAAIRDMTKQGKPTQKQRQELERLADEEPQEPVIPRLLLGDETPENLAHTLARKYPAAAIVSSEAGLIFGAHGMGKESAMRNLALLNTLWDGRELSIGRRTTESFTVRGARLTMALQVQEPTLREFFGKTGQLARGTGFLARFLVAWPQSTQGWRPFSEAPEHWPALGRFNQRIRQLLEIPAPLAEGGGLAPAMLELSPGAKAEWVRLHDLIESELRPGGDLAEVRDVASKAADNIARLAALFHVFAAGAVEQVQADAIENAGALVAWHLSESRRFFGELALPQPMADALRLDAWLSKHCTENKTTEAGKNHVRQHGPLRDGERLDAALSALAEAHRVRVERDGKRLTVRVNPAVVKEAA